MTKAANIIILNQKVTSLSSIINMFLHQTLFISVVPFLQVYLHPNKMASASQPSGSDTEECPVCLEPFTCKEPRFLACHHTVCTTCLERLVENSRDGRIPCPLKCSKKTKLPPGGVKKLQINFYINNQKKLKLSDEMCDVHEDEKLRFYCKPCKRIICRDCKLTSHEGHPSEDLHGFEKRVKNKMDLIEQIITSKMRKYKDHLNAVQQRKEAAVEKQALVEQSITDRHATLVAAADKARDEALETLKAESARLDQDYKKEINDYTQNSKFKSACYTQCKLTNVSAKSTATVVKIAEDLQLDLEMDESKLRGELEKKFPDDKDVGIVRSVTHRPPEDDTISTLVKNARSFMGSVVTSDLTVTSQPQVHVVERFTCSEEPNVRVLHLCPIDDDPPRDLDTDNVYFN
jgi:hypothetical protein